MAKNKKQQNILFQFPTEEKAKGFIKSLRELNIHLKWAIATAENGEYIVAIHQAGFSYG